jgi:two-component system KDP operon response regulator KdpE
VVRVGDLRVDFGKRLVFAGQNEIHLTPHEYKLLAILVRHAGKVLTQRQLLREVWGPGHERDVQYLRVYMGQLRRKIEPDPAHPRYITTEPGIGYRFRFPASSDSTWKAP